MNCPKCGKEARWVSNEEVYGRRYGKSYMCYWCPDCECHTPTPPAGNAGDWRASQGAGGAGSSHYTPTPAQVSEGKDSIENLVKDEGMPCCPVCACSNGKKIWCACHRKQLRTLLAAERERIAVAVAGLTERHEKHSDHVTWCGVCGSNALIRKALAIIRGEVTNNV